MNIKTHIEYYESYIPSRCRKPRYKACEEMIDVVLPEAKKSDLHLAFDDCSYDGKGKIYLYQNRLWTLAKNGESYNCHYRHEQCRDGSFPNRDHMISIANDGMAPFLLVDGKLYIETSEPRYVVMTFGLGCNHGGTALMVSYYYNGNIGKDRYFSALDGKLAVAYANQIAQHRGDTNDIGTFEESINVYLPEVVKVKPQSEHGDGDPFINSMENVIETVKDKNIAGLACILKAMKE